MVIAETIQVKVRRRIRAAGGLRGLNPDEVDMLDSDDLKTDYKFTNKNYDALFSHFNRLLFNENALKKVSTKEVNDCKTVADCVKLIKDKLPAI
jgi:hypothetical protein